MKCVTIIFSSASELMQFISIIGTVDFAIDPSGLNIKGYLPEAAIELAKEGYQATIVEESLT